MLLPPSNLHDFDSIRVWLETLYHELGNPLVAFHGDRTVWEDIRIVPGSFDRPGISDPAIVAWTPSGSGTATSAWEFQVDDIVAFTIQMPHNYKQGSDIYCHAHWTPGTRGNEENGKYVGWKLDYSWANINEVFGAMATISLSDACSGTDHMHEMTSDVLISGTGKTISSMLVCNFKRTDTGADDDWVGTASGSLPLLTGIDFHYELDTHGSRARTSK